MTWKQITEAPLYEITEYGLVRNIKSKRCIKPFKATRTGKTVPYLQIGLQVNKKKVTYKVHRLVAKVFFGGVDGFYIDHIDRNSLNNHVSNLRIVTPSQSGMNTKGLSKRKCKYKGVSIRKGAKIKKYRATINAVGHKLEKSFSTEIEAARWYDKNAKRIMGDFACTNKDLGLL